MGVIEVYTLSFTASVALSAILIAAIIRLCGKYSIYDRTGGRKIHSRKVGRLGGLGVIMAFTAVSAVMLIPAYDSSVSPLTLFAALMIVFVMGIIDDIKGLNAKVKLPLQIFSAVMAVAAGVRVHVAGTVAAPDFAGYIDIIFTVIWILAFMNAVNLIDGMDGLSSGLVMIALIFFIAVGVQSGSRMLTLSSVILLGSVTGFYIFNFPPAKIFLGDAGAYSIGFILAVLMPVSFSSDSDIRMASVPAVIFLLPFLDVAQVIRKRCWLKKGIFSADNNHIHHKLLASGYSTREVLRIMYPVASIFGALGVLYWRNGSGFCVYLFLVTVVLAALVIYRLSDMEHRTEILSSLIQSGVSIWDQKVRYHPKDVRVMVSRLNGRSSLVYGNIYEISTGGFFFKTADRIKTGDDISVTLFLGKRKPLHLKAVVVHLSSGDDFYPMGFGCMYTNAGYMARRRIRYHLLSVKADVMLREGLVQPVMPLRRIEGGRAVRDVAGVLK